MSEEIVPIDTAQPKSKLAPRWQPSKEIQEKALIEAKRMIPNGTLASDEQLEQFYDMGYKLYQAGKYKDAKLYFNLLTLAHVKEPRYMLARAACEHMLKEYYNALASYCIAGMLDPTTPVPHYHSVDCYLKTENLVGACVALKMTIKRCGEDPRFNIIKGRSTALLSKVMEDLKNNKDEKVVKFLKKVNKSE